MAEMDTLREDTLQLAFDLLDVNGCGFLDKDQCAQLFEELNEYRTLPKISKEAYDCIFYELDDSHDFKINKVEFTNLCDAISFRFEKEVEPSWLERCPNFYHSAPCICIKNFVKIKAFDYIVIFMLLLNLITVIIESTLDVENNPDQYIWPQFEFWFGWLYVVEMALKIFSFGFDAYWREGQNLIPSFTPYLAIIFCVMCLYCSLGLQLFGGLVYANNPKLEGTSLKNDDYLAFNFNDYRSGMVILFNLMVMGNWQIWMKGYVQIIGTSWALLYFISFYVITVFLLVNLVVAFVLEAFFAETELAGIDRIVLIRALKLLEQRGKAVIFEGTSTDDEEKSRGERKVWEKYPKRICQLEKFGSRP